MKCFCTFSFVILMGITLSLNGQDVPVFTIEKAKTTASSSIVSITSVGFSNISSGNLKVLYDPLVAKPLAVTTGTDLGGSLSYNLLNSGEILIGWFTFPSVTLTDGSVIFNIEFDKVSPGTTLVGFDEKADDMECQFYDGSHQKLNDIPFSSHYISGSLTFKEHASPVTKAPNLNAIENESINVPVSVTEFNKIGAVSLRMDYNPEVLSYNSAANTGGFPNLIIYNPAPGTITVSGTTGSPEGYSLPDGSVFFTLNFTYHGGTTGLNWFDDDGTSCEYAGSQSAYKLTDTPQSTYYINGSVSSELTQPTITVGDVINPATCGSDGIISLSFTHVPDGNYTMSYDGGSFPEVAVSAGVAVISAPAGIYNNLQITVNGVTSALGVNVDLTVTAAPDQPVITAGGPITFCEGDSVVLTSSEAVSYEWSTGETTQSITVSYSGSYTVTVTNAADCSATSETIEVTVDSRPDEPAKVNCWDEFVFNNSTCQWDNVGEEPVEPAPVNCWDEFTLNTNTCEWENSGTQPEEPVLACYQTATWNETTCVWDVTGTQPEAPSTECWETATWNETTCNWDVSGTQPVIPTPENCWDEFVFNNTTCQWDNIGEGPVEPAPVNCWDEFTLNTNTCEWENIGTQLEEPLVECYQTATWNETSCSWDVTGTQPEAPSTECWKTATWNETTCNWDVSGTQPVIPTPENCWDEFVFNNSTCQWDNVGEEQVEPTPVNDWDEFIFDPDSCSWKNIGMATNTKIYQHPDEMILTFYPNPFREKATIRYMLPENGRINIEVTGILGNRIALLSNHQQSAGEYLLDMDGKILVTGVYQVTLRLTNFHGGEWKKKIRIIKQ